jgi:hypothetical protein
VGGFKIAYKDPAGLKPRPTNPRPHSANQINQTSVGIKQF